MKGPLFTILIVLIAFHSSSATNTVIIKGEINQYPLKDETSLVIVDIHNLEDDPRQIRREIEDDGTFEIEFDLLHTQDIYLTTLDMRIRLLVIPGEILVLEWNYEDRNLRDKRLRVNFSGDGSERNRHLNHMLHQHRKEIDFNAGEPKGLNAKFKELAYNEFRTYRLDIQKQQKEVLEKYIQYNDVTDPLLLEWVGYFIEYQPMGHLLSYQTMHAQLNGMYPKDVKIPTSYYDFLGKIDIGNKRAIICSSYITFVSRFYYIVKYTNLLNWAPYDSLQEREGMVSAIFHGLSATTEGFAREVVLSRFFYEIMGRRDSLSKQIPPLLEKYFEIVSDRNLRATTMKRIELSFAKMEDGKSREHVNILDLGEDGDLLTTIIQHFSGKVIYIDIWATWCTPCKIEMQYYPELMQYFQDEDIVFVFLAAFSPERLWEEQIDDLELKGEHHLLNEKDYYSLEKYFKLRGFPQHVIIGKEGNIVDDNGERIYSKGFSLSTEVLNDLEELLRQ